MVLFEHPVVDISSSDIRERTSDPLQCYGHHWLLPKHSPAGVCYNELKQPLKTTFREPAHCPILDCRPNGYLSRKVSSWLFLIFEIQKCRTFSFNDTSSLCTIVVNILP